MVRASRDARAMGHVADAFDEADASGTAWTPCHRSYAVLHCRRKPAGERATVPHRLRARPDCRGAQRQPRQRPRAARRSRRAGAIFQTSSDTEVLLHLYARSKAPSVEEALVDSDCADPGRVLAGAADQGSPDRGPRSARFPSAGARKAGRRVDRVLGDVRARPDWRDLRARRRAGRASGHQRRRPSIDQAVSSAAPFAVRVRARLLRASRQLRLRPQRQRRAHRAWARAGTRGAALPPTLSCRFQTPASARRPVLPRRRSCRCAWD